MTRQIVHVKETKWVYIELPSSSDIRFLRKNYPFHPVDIEEFGVRQQRPKIDVFPSYIHLILHFPLFHGKNQKLMTSEVHFFAGKNFLVTVHDGQTHSLSTLFDRCYKNKRTASSLLSKGVAQLLYSILDAGVDDTIAILDEVSINLEYMDRQVFEADSKAIVEEISLLRRNIIYFQTILKPQIPLFNSLEKGQIKLLNGQLSAYWGTIVDRTNRMWDRLEDAHELIEGLFATNESLVQFRTNEVIKVLTIFSVMLMPLTLLSGIYGMNLISLPLANHPQSFLFVSFLMLLVTLGMILFFRFKKWL